LSTPGIGCGLAQSGSRLRRGVGSSPEHTDGNGLSVDQRPQLVGHEAIDESCHGAGSGQTYPKKERNAVEGRFLVLRALCLP
jgi:hypothetical protein